ncbi:MAG: HAMP domain-containing histidine kinase [bacterium]|nr:HAMP domain-containing histidine kinase [bacterium]
MDEGTGGAIYPGRPNSLGTLMQLEKQKVQFMRMMVHELKAPVAGAKMLVDALLFNDAVSDSPVAPMLEKVSRRMGRMTELINDLLELARVKSGDPLGEVGTIDLRAETELGCEPYRDPAEHKGLALRVDLPSEPVHARLDSQGYRLVLSNLVSNAIKYTPAGSVTVSLRQQDGWAVLEVTDTGMGSPEADVPKLFGEFFRASNAKASRIEGSGVGLAGAKSLVARFGGELALQTRENEGSTFTVRLPAKRPAPTRHRVAPARHQAA